MTTLACAAVIWINLSKEAWNNHDRKIYQRAKVVCSTNYRYKDTHPCVARFTKKEPRVYNVLCGPEKL